MLGDPSDVARQIVGQAAERFRRAHFQAAAAEILQGEADRAERAAHRAHTEQGEPDAGGGDAQAEHAAQRPRIRIGPIQVVSATARTMPVNPAKAQLPGSRRRRL
ncbi:MAG: hypothetical protein QM661_07330 [Solimonas sp.]